MTEIVGGIRQRLIRDSIYYMLYDALEQRGWFDAGRRHMPISFTGDITPQDEEIVFNTITLSLEDTDDSEAELGSTMVETTTTLYVDFFAENDSVGTELIHDVRDILAGRMSSVGRSSATVQVIDYRLATPVAAFSIDLERVSVTRAQGFPRPWQKHWYACRFEVLDHYGNEG